MYVKLQKYLKEVTILPFFVSRFFIFKAQFMKINEAKASILCLRYLFYFVNSRECVTITDTGQYCSILCPVNGAILVFLLTARDARLTNHDRAFQIVI